MTTEAKIAALKGAAERKRRDALERTNQAITKLLREGKRITFAAVAEAAEVSVAYLYKYDDLKERIAHLKNQQGKAAKSLPLQPASDKSKQVILNQLKERIKKLEAENRGLRDQNEVIYGRLCQLQAIEQQTEALKTQNASLKAESEWLKQQLEQFRLSSQSAILSTPIVNAKVTPLEQEWLEHSGISDQIQAALASLGVKLNPTLTKTIQAAPEAIVLTAIGALKEAVIVGEIERPGGWLKRAIEEGWKPNEMIQPQREVKLVNFFNQWFDMAKAKGLAVASTRGEDGHMYIFDREGVRYPFEQMLDKHPLESLKS